MFDKFENRKILNYSTGDIFSNFLYTVEAAY